MQREPSTYENEKLHRSLKQKKNTCYAICILDKKKSLRLLSSLKRLDLETQFTNFFFQKSFFIILSSSPTSFATTLLIQPKFIFILKILKFYNKKAKKKAFLGEITFLFLISKGDNMDWQDRESPGGHKMSRLVFGMFSSQWLETTENVSLEFSHQKQLSLSIIRNERYWGIFFRWFLWFSNTVISFRFTRKVLYKRVNITLNKLFGAAVIISHNRWEWEKRKQGHPVVIIVQLFAHLLTLIKVGR